MKTDLIECRLPSPNATVLPYEAQMYVYNESSSFNKSTYYRFRKFELVVTGYMSVLCVILGTIGNLYGVRSVHITNFDKVRSLPLEETPLVEIKWVL